MVQRGVDLRHRSSKDADAIGQRVRERTHAVPYPAAGKQKHQYRRNESSTSVWSSILRETRLRHPHLLTSRLTDNRTQLPEVWDQWYSGGQHFPSFSELRE